MRLRDVGLTKEEIKAKVDKYMIETYERFDMIAERGKGMYVYDENGTPYLDFYAGIAVNSAGSCNDKVVLAVIDQCMDIMQTFNYPYTVPQALLAEKICTTIGIMVEPVQGEGGVHPATKEFLTGLRKLCDEKGLLLLLDEVQSGWCRTGAVMSYMNYGIKPDIVSMAKALGGGMPIAAICAREDVSKAFTMGSHGSTFGGHPVCCAAALAEVNELLDKDLAGNAKKMGAYFLEQAREKLPHLKEARGQGCFLGLEFDDKINSVDLKHKCFDKHMLSTAIGEHVLRLVPPLILQKEHVDKAIAIIKESVEELAK